MGYKVGDIDGSYGSMFMPAGSGNYVIEVDQDAEIYHIPDMDSRSDRSGVTSCTEVQTVESVSSERSVTHVAGLGGAAICGNLAL